MDNLRSVLNIVLGKIPAGEILSERVSYNNITEESFVKLAGYYVKNYTNDELKNLFYYVQNAYNEQTEYLKGNFDRRIKQTDKFDVFNIILLFAAQVLQEQDGMPVCRYEHLLRWRMTSHQLDEDVFTTAFLAYRDLHSYRVDRDFSWRTVITHNNQYLKKILDKGMADNHFHLKGSAPQFPLSWLYMMNHVVSNKVKKSLNQYSKKRLSVSYFTGENEEHLYVSYLKAALIRCFLYAKIENQLFVLKDDFLDGNLSSNENTSGKEDWASRYEKITEEKVLSLLKSPDEILMYRSQIQNNINTFRSVQERSPVVELDYAGAADYYHNAWKADTDGILSGERWFLYQMFHLIYSHDESFKDYYNLFYAYLVVKETIRSEMVQTNSNIGYDNFERYQNRKEDFIEDTVYEKYYIRMAVKGTMINQSIRYLEARISPKMSAEINKKAINKLDKNINCPELENQYFYVYHFVKEKNQKQEIESDILCRHYQKRKTLKKQAFAIATFREKYPKEARRLRGIDACASEIGCRPEVFAQTFRYLSNHMVYLSDRTSNEWVEHDKWLNEEEKDLMIKGQKELQPIPQLRMTYHIGEDYLDIVDGLRALDEMIRFLKFNCGSRLGHSLVLGVDVKDYYELKKHRILISQQEYLDNLVWVYYKIKKFALKDYEDLEIFIEQEYSKYFHKIYSNYICDTAFDLMLKDAVEYFKKDEEMIVEGYCNSHFQFGIAEYYAAWKLRGDDPECYIHGYYEEKDDLVEWDSYSVDRDNLAIYKNRYHPACAYLYHLYHYNSHVKKEGDKIIEITVNYQFVKCVQEIQECMKKWIATLGIGIEVNPSSNYMIGTFKRYDKHPITKFYNKDLVTSEKELEECPQIPVCINTDDQGIFSTYLDNEYALQALSLEKAKDEDGKEKYNRTRIYQWIDNLREMGINLSFTETSNQKNNW